MRSRGAASIPTCLDTSACAAEPGQPQLCCCGRLLQQCRWLLPSSILASLWGETHRSVNLGSCSSECWSFVALAPSGAPCFPCAGKEARAGASHCAQLHGHRGAACPDPQPHGWRSCPTGALHPGTTPGLCSARIPPCQHLQCPASTVQLHSSQALRFVVALTQHICSGEVMEPSITAWLLSHPRAEMFHPAWPGLGRRVRCGVRRWAGTQAARGALPAPGCGSPELVPSRCFWLRSR